MNTIYEINLILTTDINIHNIASMLIGIIFIYIIIFFKKLK